MERQCQEPHCLQLVPEHLFQTHQDEHLAERLATEEFESERQNQNKDEALARAMALGGEPESSNMMDADSDYQLALALNREMRAEEEARSFRMVQKREIGVESQEDEERRSKVLKQDSEFKHSNQMTLGPDLVPTRSELLANQTRDLIYGLQRALDSDNTTAYSVLCHPKTSHLRSQFLTTGWGCGYHNAQMLLSYIREAEKEQYQKAFGEDIPSIHKLQTLIEVGWAKGIDREGAVQLRNSLLSTRKWIGTTEIYTLLTSAGFRCFVHDFDFRRVPFSASLIKYVDDYFKCTKPADAGRSTASTCRVSERPPLYFQHSGHSRTIVGIEHLKSGKINLLLFDPSKSPSSMVKEYAQGKIGKKNLSSEVLKPFRAPMDDIAKKKEYQILRLQEGMMDDSEVEARRKVHFIKMN